MSIRLSTLARLINEQFPQWRATVEPVIFNTDRKIKGTRLRHPGKGRRGNELAVWMRRVPYSCVFRHNSAETYRCNAEAVAWFVEQGGVLPESNKGGA